MGVFYKHFQLKTKVLTGFRKLFIEIFIFLIYK
jgi:hypothetical protein